MLSVVAGVCHQVSSGDSTVLLVPPAPTLGVTPPPVLLCSARRAEHPKFFSSQGTLPVHAREKSPIQSGVKHLCDARVNL